ncbi:Gcd10p family [Novymonas esmeraldas]|uniref:tRNA (adenine(58)-N(1))-methyltransferase non-catalytic subunit TRM6 n=1 Tax=Novymonas esmeraldas TaxID=1808958 RepID=A0AAW0EMH7_9TRYP
MSVSGLVEEDDYVFISGGGSTKIVQVKKDVKVRLGRSGAALATTLIGVRYGGVCHLDHAGKKFVESNDYPDLDITEVGDAEEVKDNRDLVDDNTNQQLSNDEVAAIRREKGLDELLQTLVEKSASYGTKTNFAQEKYLRKKQKKYGTLFKVERVTVDNLAELHLPTVNPSDNLPDDARSMRLRADTVALLLHHSDVHHNSRVLLYEKTNGVLPASLLTRMSAEGRIFQILDKNAQPDPTTAVKVMRLPLVKERWKAVPRNPGFLQGVEEVEKSGDGAAAGERPVRPQNGGGVTQWVKGLDARQQLLETPADSLVVCDDEAPQRAVADLLPFLACGGHLVVYSPFLEDLTGLFLELRSDCVNIQISETWYRHHQVLPKRTHPTVNMSTAAGYLLTAIKVGRSAAAAPVLSVSEAGHKRAPADDGDAPPRKSARTEASEAAPTPIH